MSLQYFRVGRQVRLDSTSVELKQTPGDHVRILLRAEHIDTTWIPKFTAAQLEAVEAFLWRAGHAYAKKRVIVCIESYGTEYAKLLKAFREGRPLDQFDTCISQMAGVIAKLPLGYVAFEWGHEPGLYKDETQDPIEAAAFIQAWWSHVVPKVKAITKAPQILPTPAWGWPEPAPWFQHLTPVPWSGCGLGLRCYFPRDVTKFGTSPWPNPLSSADVDHVNRPFTKEGLKGFVQAGIDQARRLNLRPIFAEAGVTNEAVPGLRDRPESQAYLADMRSVFQELSASFVEWVD